jgi:cell division transport system permease protein
MKMNPKKIKYIFKQAFKSMWRNRMMGAASIGSVTAVLIILGFVLIVVLNVNNMAMVAKETFDQIAVYIAEGVDEDQIEEMGKAFREIDGVMAVAFQTKDYALESVKKDWGEDAILLQDLRNNPFPDTYIVQLTDVSKADEVIAKLQTFEGVERVRYYQDAVNTLIKLADFVKRFGAGITIVLLLISVFIISNTIKITVLSRQREIELMQYIGATNGYVRGPLILEGIMLGLLGSLVAILLIMLGYSYTINYLAGRYVALISGMSGYLVGVEMVLDDLIIIFMTIGVGIGILGSLVSLKKFLSI